MYCLDAFTNNIKKWKKLGTRCFIHYIPKFKLYSKNIDKNFSLCQKDWELSISVSFFVCSNTKNTCKCTWELMLPYWHEWSMLFFCFYLLKIRLENVEKYFSFHQKQCKEDCYFGNNECWLFLICLFVNNLIKSKCFSYIWKIIVLIYSSILA